MVSIRGIEAPVEDVLDLFPGHTNIGNECFKIDFSVFGYLHIVIGIS